MSCDESLFSDNDSVRVGCSNDNAMTTTGLETYFFSNSHTFASGSNLNSQVVVSYSQFSFTIISENDSLKDAYMILICCLQIGNDKTAKQ